MKKHEAAKLIEVIQSFVSAGVDMEEKADRSQLSGRKGTAFDPDAKGAAVLEIGKARTMEGTDQAGGIISRFDEPALEKLYQSFKARLLEELPVDPVMLHLLTVRPEIIVDVEKRVIEMDGSGDLKGRIARLIAGGFMATHRKPFHVNNELERVGTKASGNRLSEALAWLKKAGFLLDEAEGWIAAPGVKVTERTIESRE